MEDITDPSEPILNNPPPLDNIKRKGNEPKEHHFVPQAYLRFFLSTKPDPSFGQKGLFPGLYVLNIKNVQEGFKVNIGFKQSKSICYDDDYYNLEKYTQATKSIYNLTDFKNDPLFLEKVAFSKGESKYPAIIRELILHNMLPMNAAIELADFIILMKIRNPTWKKSIERNTARYVDVASQDILKKYFNDPNSMFALMPLEVRKDLLRLYQESMKSDSELSQRMWFQNLLNFSGYGIDNNKLDILRKALLDFQWILLKAPEKGSSFITTDNPGVSLDFDLERLQHLKLKGNFQFFFPITPKVCLTLGSPEGFDFAFSNNSSVKNVIEYPCTDKTVTFINDCMSQFNNNLLIGSTPDYLEEIRAKNFVPRVPKRPFNKSTGHRY